MKPLKGFELLRPRTLVGALEIMATLEHTQPISGGTDLIPTFKELGCKSKNLVDLSLIQELNGVMEENDKILIGPTTTHAQILTSKLIEERAPALHDAARWIGSVQIRNRGTVGGNICNASPAADTAPPLIVHAAEAQVSSLDDARWIPLHNVFAGPKKTILEPIELLTSLRFPIVKSAASSFQRIGRRKGFTLSVVNTAVYIEREKEKLKEIRIALGSVAPTPLRILKVEDEFRGKEMSEELVNTVAKTCMEIVKPIDDVRGTAEYRRDMVAVLVKRAMREAWTRTGGAL